MRNRILALTAVLLCFASSAFAIGKGTSMLAIQITSGTADLYSPPSGGYISAYDHSELGLGAEYWNLLSDDYAFALSAGMGTFNETDKPGQGAPSGAGDFKYSQSSFNVRIGGDRVVKVGERALFYFGPGFQYWSGKAKFENSGAPSVETENVTRLSLDGRIGATMLIGPTWGITMQVGHRVGYASAEDQGAKATWWPSSNYASSGVQFMFGGN